MLDRKWLSRTALITGDEGLDRLAAAHVIVIGLGGVGSYAAEFIARSGVGEMTIVDGDDVEASNRNRQLPALATTEGQSKALIMEERLKAINPEIKINVIRSFLMPEVIEEVLNKPFDYVVEAIDSITPKTMVIAVARAKKLRIVSSMGAGGKLDPTKLIVTDISETHTCRFAKYVRKRLKKMGVRKGVKAVFSSELVIRESLMMTDGSRFKKSAYGTISYLPATFGAVCASVAIRDLLDDVVKTKKSVEVK
ncbi:MAG: tRNA threonylcarbamoyladenosine dehydratase [Bacteroidia bacterium]|nr:tRNA threonylcarbamoyladenosine dehydratase [Bacteroidia bacterium]